MQNMELAYQKRFKEIEIKIHTDQEVWTTAIKKTLPIPRYHRDEHKKMMMTWLFQRKIVP